MRRTVDRTLAGRRHLPPVLAAALAVLLAAGPLNAQSDESPSDGAQPEDGVTFRDPLDDTPLDVPLPEGDRLTPAVEQFHRSGENPYVGDAEAAAEGERLYQRLCQACHLPDGSGRIGPSLADDEWTHPRDNPLVAQFEIIWAGGAGAMQSFSDRLSQDEILKVIAHVETLRGS